MQQNDQPIRVGMIIGKWVGGGVESVIMNYYRHIDRNKIQFDFICDEDSTSIPYEEIKKMGGRVIFVPPYQRLFKYLKECKRVFKKNNYKIVHSNINTLSVFPLYAAKKAGVPIRIAHSHSAIINRNKEIVRNIIKNILKNFSRVYATHYFACSKQAAISQFGKRAYCEGNVTIINNAIDIEKFDYNEEIRNKIRKELNIKDSDIVIGHVGRFVETKNHDFIIDVFERLLKRNQNYRLLLIGQGPLENKIKSKVNNLDLDDKVIFLGQRNDIYLYYQAMDAFIFPSLYEGLGMGLVEAQAAALPAIASLEVPEVTKVSDKVYYMSLYQSKDEWADKMDQIIDHKRKGDLKRIKDAGFDIKTESKKLENIYLTILN